jgi:hypothetical protein
MAVTNPAGSNQPETARTAGYDRSAVAHVLGVASWREWEDMLGWLRSESPNDPSLNPDEYRVLRQDAERACQAGAPFSNDLQELWAQLRRHHL